MKLPFLDTHSLSGYLPYEAYQDHLFYNRSTLGFGFEGLPIMGFDENAHRQMTGMFQYLLPEGSNIQYLLFADPFIGDTLKRFGDKTGSTTLKDPKIMEKVTAYRVQHFKNLADYTHHDKHQKPARQFRLILSVTLPINHNQDFNRQKERALDLREQVETTLQQIGLSMAPLKPEGVIDFYDQILLSRLKDTDFCSDRIVYDALSPLRESMPTQNRKVQVQKEGLLIDAGRALFRGYAITKYPTHWNQSQMSSLIGDSFSDLQQINTPFFISYGVHIPKQNDLALNTTAKASHLERQVNSPISKYLPKMREELSEYQFVANQLANGHRFVKTNMTIGLIGHPDHMSAHESKLVNLYRGKGFEIKRDDYLHLQSLLTIMPMSFGDDLLKELKGSQKLKTTISSESANLLPLQGEWYGTETPGMLFQARRGQVLTWSPFDNNAGNYNVSVVGRSGAGKSVFMQELMTSTLRQNGKVFVLDVGRSFQKTCLLLGGQFVEFTPKKPICVNPFTQLKGLNAHDAEDRLATLKPVLMSMVAPHEALSDLEVSYLDQAMRAVFFENQDKTTFTKIASFLLSHEDSRANDLGTRLFPYTKDGVYGKFFEGASTVNFTDTFVVVEFEELKERKDLQSVIIQMVIVNMSNVMFLGDRKTPFMMCFDEAWDMLRGNQTGVFIETLARRLRKYNGSLVVGTQSVNDFYATPGALAAFENSDWLCMLSQKPESISILKEKKRVAMTDAMERDIRSVHTKAGAYAEVMINGPHGYAINRLVLDKFSQTLYSTTPKIYNAVQELVTAGFAMADAIEIVAGLKEQKTPSKPQKQSLGHDVPMKESAADREEEGAQNQNQAVAA